jgi:hypothetical protein
LEEHSYREIKPEDKKEFELYKKWFKKRGIIKMPNVFVCTLFWLDGKGKMTAGDVYDLFKEETKKKKKNG